MNLVDLHVHSTCSVDGASSIADYARRAMALGLAELGICEHVDLDPRDEGYGYLDLDHYRQQIEAARAMTDGVQVLQGLELNYQASLEAEVRAWAEGYTWDYVILSVHLVDYDDGWANVSEPGTAGAYFASHSQRQAYQPYFEELHRAAQSGLGDVLGHFDIVKRFAVPYYGPFDPKPFEEEIRAVLRAAVGAGLGLEINTSGQRQPPAEPFPGLEVLGWYRELGGEILTVGSDAHHVDFLGAGIAEALDLARAAGFRAVTTFEAGQARSIDL